ncbi:hypothetical protein KB553_08180 [Chryseobacterium rhizoplanae]|uniref:hypothetical protein n=1 Tax=Chryseobacterium TaxID=59732 RepID=UPI001CE28930|nr:hypothetical protein [Chryseobacterium rhizoplanae]UCA61503.1 hypothetical protein KB553_08180 [Chryseobacterium rhizoplanae]
MKYFIYAFFLILLSCNQKDSFKEKDITGIIYISDKIVYDITNNFYILDKRYKKQGKHNLMMSSHDLYLVKKKIVDEKIYQLDDSLKFVKSCEKGGCLSEIIIKYKSGRKQHFIFDNSNYKDNFNSKKYKRIISIEEIIGEVIIHNINEPEPVNISL